MKLIYALLLLPLLAFGAAPGDLVENKFVPISVPSGTGSTMFSVSGKPDVSSMRGVLAFSGGAFASGYGALGSLLVFGGGHTDYSGNEIYAFDVATGRWAMPFTRSASTACNATTSLISDGKPCASHTYDHLTYSPNLNEFYKVGSASNYPTGGGGTGHVHGLALTGTTWRTVAHLNTFNDACANGAGESSLTTWDSANNKIWWHGSNKYVACGSGASQGNQLQSIDPVTGVVSSYLGANPGLNGTMGFSPRLKALVLLDTRTTQQDLHVWDVSTGTPVRYLNVPYTGTFPDEASGFEWDPIADKGVAYKGQGTTVVTLTPPAGWETTHTGNWVFANVTAIAGSASPTQVGVYTLEFGRWAYVPGLCGFVTASYADTPVYAYRLTGGAGPGCGGSPPADPPPAVSLTTTQPSINTGGSAPLTWSTSNVGACTASAVPAVTGWSGTKASSGTQSVSPTATSTFTLTCAGLLSQSGNTAQSSVQVIVNTGTGGTGDFATRCAAAGVKRCTTWDTDADFTLTNLQPDGYGNIQGVRDTSVKSSGVSSLRFTLPINAGENSAGYWIAPLWDEALAGGTWSDHFGPGETLYWQYRQRYDSAFLTPSTHTGSNGWKQWILHPASGGSCTGYQMVQVNNYLRGYPQWYKSCSYPLEIALANGDFVHQMPDVDCRYRNQTSTAPGTCKRYVADTWTTYSYKFTLGAYNQPATRLEVWTGNEGEAPIKVFDLSGVSLPLESDGSKFSRVQLTPYQTNKPNGQGAVSRTWYDDLIVSTQPIAWPAGGSAPPPPTVSLTAVPSSIASGLTSTLDWTSTNATTCTASGSWAGARATSGQQDTGALTSSQVYTMTCTGAGGTSSPSTATVTVTAAPPAVSITASPNPVTSGSGSTISWNVTGATSCLASGGWAGLKNPVSGSQFSVALSASTSFTLDCTGAGGSQSGSVTVNVTPPAPTVIVTASPNPVDYGAQTTLTKTTTNCTSARWTAGQPAGGTAVSGTEPSVALTTATTFTLECSNAGATVSGSVLVNVNPIPNATVTLTATPPTITSGGTSRLTWVTTNANACTGTGGTFAGARTAGGGFLDVTPTTTTAYGITCTAAAGASASDSAQVIVNSVVADPVLSLAADLGQITSGTSTTLRWTVSDATSCTASGDWSGAKSASGGSESTGNLTATKVYILTCTNAGGGTGSSGTQVNVTAAPVNPNTDIMASRTPISIGDPVTITWSCTNSTTATPSAGGADPDWLSAVSLSGSRTVYPIVNTTYTMTCNNGVTPNAKSVTVTVNAARTLSLTASPAIAFTGGSSTLTWTTGGPLDACIWLKGPYTNTIVAADGSVSTGTLTVPTEFEIMCLVGSEVLVGFPPDFRSNPLFKIAAITVNVTPNTPINSRHRRRWWRFRR